MKQGTLGPLASAFFVLALGGACRVVVQEGDETGGQSTSGTGGSDALGGSASTSGGRQDSATGGVADGGSTSAQGGKLSTQGGTTSSGGSASGGGNTGGQVGTPYTEECGAPEPVDNNDRDTAIALGPGATLCLDDPSDNDWFYVDTPADGKAHVLQLDFEQEPAAWTSVDIFSKTDGSNIDSFRLDRGVKSSAFVTLGPGARTLIDIRAYNVSDGKTSVKASLTPENDSFEPNNERDAAAAIKVGQKVSGQMLVPYVAKQQAASVDWFKVELTAGDHVFHLTAVPQETWLDIRISDSARVELDWGHPPNKGAIFELPFTAPGAGTYYFSVASYLNAPPVVSLGTKPHFLGESYSFQID